MNTELETKNLKEGKQKDKIEFYHLLPGKPDCGSEYYFQHCLGSTNSISEKSAYFVDYPYHFSHHPIYSFELAFNYYLINVLPENKLKPSYFHGHIDYWIDCTLRDGILHQFIKNIKDVTLKKNIELEKELVVREYMQLEKKSISNNISPDKLKDIINKSHKTKHIKYERVIRNSIDLVVAWLEDLDLNSHYYCDQSPKLNAFLEDYPSEKSGNDKEIHRKELCICKYCCNEFTEKKDSKVLIPVDQLHTYDKASIKKQNDRDKNIYQIKSCRSKYKNTFRNPLAKSLCIAKEKLRILYVSLFNTDNLNNYINDFSSSLVSRSDSRFFESARSVLAEYNIKIEKYKKISYINQMFFIDVKRITNTIATKLTNKIVDNPCLFSNKAFDIYFDKDRHTMVQVPVPDRYEEVISKSTRIEEFKDGGAQELIDILAVEKALPKLTTFEIYDLIELQRRNEESSWYNL